jgi:hypothetical protein
VARTSSVGPSRLPAALNDECFEYDECELLAPFVDAGKAAFQVTYGDQSDVDRVCPEANAMDLDALIKESDLGPFRIACR